MTKNEIRYKLYSRGWRAAVSYHMAGGDVTFFLLGTKSSFGRGFNAGMDWINDILLEKY